MKRCPTCKRTYADDGFTFCLDDGALLSAPYDPQSEKPISTIRSSGPPPTAVLPDEPNPAGRSQGEEKATQGSDLPPTIASPGHAKPDFASQLDTSEPSKKKFKPLYIAIPVIILAVLFLWAALHFYQRSMAQCPKVTVSCSQYANSAYCYLENAGSAGNHEPDIGPAIASLRPMMALQAASAALPKGINKVTWSVSPGQIRHQELGGMGINTTGLSGQVITVKATFTGDSSFCSGTAATTFVVLPSTAP